MAFEPPPFTDIPIAQLESWLFNHQRVGLEDAPRAIAELIHIKKQAATLPTTSEVFSGVSGRIAIGSPGASIPIRELILAVSLRELQLRAALEFIRDAKPDQERGGTLVASFLREQARAALDAPPVGVEAMRSAVEALHQFDLHRQGKCENIPGCWESDGRGTTLHHWQEMNRLFASAMKVLRG